MKFFKKFRLETYLLILLPALQIIRLLIFHPSLIGDSWTKTVKAVLFYFFFGGYFLLTAFLVLYLYLFVKVALRLQDQLIFKLKLAPAKKEGADLSKIAKSASYLLLAIGTSTLAASLEIGNLLTTTPEKVARGSIILMNLDKAVFGIYPAFANLPQIGSGGAVFLITVYQALGILLPLLFLALASSNTMLFRKYVLVFSLCTVIPFPIWYALPALSPHFMFRFNVFNQQIPENIQKEISGYRYEPALAAYIDGAMEKKVKKVDAVADQEQSIFPFTTFPSMHGAWGVMIAYFSTMLWPPLGIISIPWAVLNLFASVYTQWHYAVDMALGALIALIAIALVNWLIKKEGGYFTGAGNRWALIEAAQKDIKKLPGLTRKTFQLLRLPWKAR